MSEISEGEKVITPGGEVEEFSHRSTDGSPLTKDGSGMDKYASNLTAWNKGDLIKLSEPLRVRVDSEWQAEALVSLARENEFSMGNWIDDNYSEVRRIQLRPDGKSSYAASGENSHLTFVDLPQIEAWIEYHAESEHDECETCGGDGGWNEQTAQPSMGNPENMTTVEQWIDCPDCTDDSEDGERSYSQRKPHRQEQDPIPDGQFDNAPDSEECEEPKQGTPEYRLNRLSEITQNKTDYEPHEAKGFETYLIDYIDQLQSDLEDVKEERGKMSDKLTKINNILDNQK